MQVLSGAYSVVDLLAFASSLGTRVPLVAPRSYVCTLRPGQLATCLTLFFLALLLWYDSAAKRLTERTLPSVWSPVFPFRSCLLIEVFSPQVPTRVPLYLRPFPTCVIPRHAGPSPTLLPRLLSKTPWRRLFYQGVPAIPVRGRSEQAPRPRHNRSSASLSTDLSHNPPFDVLSWSLLLPSWSQTFPCLPGLLL